MVISKVSGKDLDVKIKYFTVTLYRALLKVKILYFISGQQDGVG